jgi:glucosylceramidase
MPGNLPNVAFRTPEGKKVLVVINTAPAMKNFRVTFRGKTVQLSLDSGAAATYIW